MLAMFLTFVSVDAVCESITTSWEPDDCIELSRSHLVKQGVSLWSSSEPVQPRAFFFFFFKIVVCPLRVEAARAQAKLGTIGGVLGTSRPCTDQRSHSAHLIVEDLRRGNTQHPNIDSSFPILFSCFRI